MSGSSSNVGVQAPFPAILPAETSRSGQGRVGVRLLLCRLSHVSQLSRSARSSVSCRARAERCTAASHRPRARLADRLRAALIYIAGSSLIWTRLGGSSGAFVTDITSRSTGGDQQHLPASSASARRETDSSARSVRAWRHSNRLTPPLRVPGQHSRIQSTLEQQ